MSEQPDFLAETADLNTIRKRYGISLPKLYDWLHEGLPSMKIGRKRLIHIPTADDWVKAKLTGQGLSTNGSQAQATPKGGAK